jgi:hypothetical protein
VVDLVAAAVDHVLLAVEHPHIVVGVLRPDIAGAPVAADDVFRGRGRIAPADSSSGEVSW